MEIQGITLAGIDALRKQCEGKLCVCSVHVASSQR